MQRSCSISLCDCPGVDAPITNISAEAPDPFLFWGQIWNPYNPYRPIPLDPEEYVKVDCDDLFNLFFSIYDPVIYAGTQLQANQQALAAQLGCTWPPPTPGQIYENDAQTATVYCADGSAFTYTVDSGTLVSPELDAVLGAAWLVAANAWAANYALEQASALRACITNEPTEGDLPPGTPGEPPPTPTTPPSGGLIPNVVWLCKDDELYRTYSISGSGLTPFTISIVDGSIPTGTLFSQIGPRKAVVSGFPSAPGEYQFKLRAVSTTAPIVTSEVWAAIFVFGITNADLPNGALLTAYSEVLSAAGGTAPYTFALSPGSGPLPDGLTLASDGTISGTPTVEDTFPFTVTITDAHGGTCEQDLDISVGVCPDWSTLVWTAPAILDNGLNGVATVVATGNTVQFDAISGTANCAVIQGMQGTLVYTGDAWDSYLIFNVTQYIPKPIAGSSQTHWTFEVKQGSTVLAQCYDDPPGTTNKFKIIDADGTRILTGDLPGSFSIHLHGNAAVAETITIQDGGLGWMFVCPNNAFSQGQLTYDITLTCEAPP